MRTEVDQSGCIGCGLCASTCPKVFAMGDDQKAQVMANPVPPIEEEAVRSAADTCPVSVISIED